MFLGIQVTPALCVEPKYLPGRIWVQMKPDKSDQEIDSFLACYGILGRKEHYNAQEVLDGRLQEVYVYRQNAHAASSKYRDLITPLGQEEFWLSVVRKLDVVFQPANQKAPASHRVEFEDYRGPSIPDSLKERMASSEVRQLPTADLVVTQDSESLFAAMSAYLKKHYGNHAQAPSRMAANQPLPSNCRRFYLNHLPKGSVTEKYLVRISIDVAVTARENVSDVTFSVDGRYVAGLAWFRYPDLDSYKTPLLETYPEALLKFADEFRQDIRQAVHDGRLQP
jgi:hypothetical protein